MNDCIFLHDLSLCSVTMCSVAENEEQGEGHVMTTSDPAHPGSALNHTDHAIQALPDPFSQHDDPKVSNSIQGLNNDLSSCRVSCKRQRL